MRNLKKVLALVLAMAMSLSLAVTAGAAFTDQDDINYGVAVDTMVELGVINGYTDGSFKPANAVTRAEAAKMIAYTVAGADEATINYYDGATKFEDVTGSYAWAAAAVNYCAGKNIIAGRSETVFDPGASVTGAELTKMILVALGYEPETANKAETLVGANWMTNAISMGLKLDLYEGLNKDFVATQAANREETAQIIYNALGVATKNVEFVIDDYYVYSNGDDLLEEAFGATATDTVDNAGRPATLYSDFNDKDIDDITIAEYADFTFTGEMKEKDLFKAIGAEGVKATGNKYITMTNIYVDGSLVVEEATPVAEDEEPVPASEPVYNDSTDTWFGWGTTAEVFETDVDNVYNLVIIHEYIGTVTGVTKADEDAGTERTITIGDAGEFETEDFAKKDVVLYTIDAEGIATVKAAPSIEGECTKITNGDTYTIDGVAYKISEKADMSAPAVKDSGSWYVDSMGNLMMVKEADDAEVFYGFLLDYAAYTGDDADLLGNGAANAGEKFKFVDEKGEVVVLDGAYETNDDGDITEFVGESLEWTTGESDVLFSYELNSKGEISAIYAGYAKGVNGIIDITKGAAEIGTAGKFGNDETLYFYIDNTVDGEEEYAVYTGFASAPSKEDAKIAGWFIDEDGKTVEAIAVYVSDIAGQSDDDYIYFASDDNEVEYDGDEEITTYTDVYVNGEKTSVKFDTTKADVVFEVGGLYTFTTSTKTGCATLESENLLTLDAEVTTIASTYFKAGNFYYVDSETVFYEIDEDGESMVKVDAMEALSDNDVYDVVVLYVDGGADKDNEADMVVFQVIY